MMLQVTAYQLSVCMMVALAGRGALNYTALHSLAKSGSFSMGRATAGVQQLQRSCHYSTVYQSQLH